MNMSGCLSLSYDNVNVVLYMVFEMVARLFLLPEDDRNQMSCGLG